MSVVFLRVQFSRTGISNAVLCSWYAKRSVPAKSYPVPLFWFNDAYNKRKTSLRALCVPRRVSVAHTRSMSPEMFLNHC